MHKVGTRVRIVGAHLHGREIFDGYAGTVIDHDYDGEHLVKLDGAPPEFHKWNEGNEWYFAPSEFEVIEAAQ